jgi:hypothetical protein
MIHHAICQLLLSQFPRTFLTELHYEELPLTWDQVTYYPQVKQALLKIDSGSWLCHANRVHPQATTRGLDDQ